MSEPGFLERLRADKEAADQREQDRQQRLRESERIAREADRSFKENYKGS